jgi:ubiquinone/menaquinone biosynthesis C-methylase UbiE
MPVNYNPVAGYYDFLSRLLFGQSEIRAQVQLLASIRPGDRVLIVGGGTGWVLEKIAAVHSSGLSITYVESSSRMMARSKRRDCRQNQVSFIQLPIEQFTTTEQYDCILTAFLFDNFSASQATAVFRVLDPLLKTGGHWLFADFYLHKGKPRFWQALLLQSMYIAARILCKVETQSLVDMEPIFADAHYRQLYTSYYYRQFIQSVVYQKKEVYLV